MIELSPDAVFIADAHYNPLNRPELLEHLRTIRANEIVFMGDVFDLLIGGISSSIRSNREIIELVNELCHTKSIIILEGNHDFRLKKLFKKAKIVPLHKQPLLVTYQGKRTALAHGDNGGSWHYRLYTRLVRDKHLLSIVDFVDTRLTRTQLYQKVAHWVYHKLRCHAIEDFASLALSRLAYYERFEVEQVIEGHFHQGKSYEHNKVIYHNLAAFGCQHKERT